MSNPEPSSDAAGSGGEKEIVFVSYTGTNVDVARWIATTLHHEKYRVIFQEATFRKDRSFLTEMDDALKSGGRVLALLSPAYVASSYCRDEWQVARQTEKREERGALLALRIADFTVDGILALYPYADLVGVVDEAEAKRVLLEHLSPPAPFTKPAPFVPVAKAGKTTPEATPLASPPHAPVAKPAAVPKKFFTPAADAKFPEYLRRPPLPPNPDLTDREIEIARFDAIRTKHGTPDAPRAIVLLGQGGIGKTQLCVHLAHRIRDDIEVFLFVNADTPDIFRSSLAQYATAAHLGLPEDGGTSDRDRAAAVRAWLVQNGGWFLAIENVDSEATEAIVHEFIEGMDLNAPPDKPPILLHHTGTVIVTARHWQQKYSYEVLDMRLFAQDVGARFLMGRCGPGAGTEAEARELSKEFGGLPLAHEQAAHYIEHIHDTYVEYLKYIHEGITVLKPSDQRGHTRYQYAAELTWKRQLPHLSPLALHLFRLTAFLLPDEIPAALLLHENNRHTMPPGNRREALAELDAHHLIQHHGGTIGVHRYIHGPLRRQMQPVEGKALLTALLDQFSGYVPTLPNSFEYNSRPVWTPLAPHLHECLNAAHTSGLDAEPFGYLSGECGNYLGETADLARAEPHMRRAIEAGERAGKTESVNFAARCENLGLVLRAQGHYADAEHYQRRALEIHEKALDPTHPDVATVCRSLGLVLRSQGNYEEARRYQRRALEIHEKALGPAHPCIAKDCGSLGLVLRDQGNYAEAERYFRRALEIHEKALGPAHPHVARDCGNLGSVLSDQGNYAEAERYHRRALEIDEKALGAAHPSVAIDRYQLGNALREPAQQEEAERLLRAGIAGLEARPDLEQRFLAFARWRLAQWHERNGRTEEARAEGVRALEIFTKAQGAEHPETKKIQKWLDAL